MFVLWLFCILQSSSSLWAFYVPGVTPNEFKKGESLSVNVVKMTSTKTQLPYKYFELKFCSSKYVPEYSKNIGEILRGDEISGTAYTVKMRENIPCTRVCEDIPLNGQEASAFVKFIENDYSVHLIMDNLPCATRFEREQDVHYVHGYQLGLVVNGVTYINNHLRFILRYNSKENGLFRFVGFEVQPMSIDEKFWKEGECPPADNGLSNWKEMNKDTKSIRFSYEVLWKPSEIRWASRWDVYLNYRNGEVHWFSIINSLIIVFFLTGIITMILIRVLRRDIAKYNRDDDAEDILEESGWKLVHGDVFRPPRFTRLLTALFGSGVQLFCMVFIVIFFAMLGMLSPASRGALMTAALFTYVFMGLFAGYFAGRLYKTLRGLNWKSTAMTTGALYPFIVLTIGLLLNSFIWYKGSSAAVPFVTMLALLSMWLGISMPLVFVGFSFGYRKRGYEHPIQTNQIPRAVPEQRLRNGPLVTSLLCGALSFGAVFVEVFFIYRAFWESRFYYLFGFLFAVFIILIVCVAQAAIAATYFQLCTEDYHWWWRSFIVSGSPAMYLLLYSTYYYLNYLDITQFVPTIIFFGYTALMVITFWILTGSIGFISTFIFLRYIYSAIKID